MFRVPFSVPIYASPEIVDRFRRDGLRIIEEFWHLFCRSMVSVDRTRWQGVPICKLPSDLWVLQEIIFELKPDLIIETGSAHGGSAAYMAMLLDLQNRGRIVTVDTTDYPDRPSHPRIEYLAGSSTDPAIVAAVTEKARGCDTVLVILDSAHFTDHVRQEIACYAPLVTKGSYL